MAKSWLVELDSRRWPNRLTQTTKNHSMFTAVIHKDADQLVFSAAAMVP